MDYIKEFTSKLQDLDRSKNIATVFADFTTLCQCALSQPFYRNPNIEQRYQNIICNYTKEQADAFKHLEWFRDNFAKEKSFTGLILYTGERTMTWSNGMFTVLINNLWE